MVDSRRHIMRRSYRDDPKTGEHPGERRFASRVELRYLFEPATERPDALVVAFSAAHDLDAPPRYYTSRALRAATCHRLFVLDDHGPVNGLPRPSWYLGASRRDTVPRAVEELVTAFRTELRLPANRVLTCGASMGGWAALYFGARLEVGHAIAGEPQTFLGLHLLQASTRDIASHVAGGAEVADREYLDNLLFEAFEASRRPPQVHLFCGRGSPYYERDVLPLTRVLDELGIACELTLADFSEHVPDLGRHFPAYLTARLEALLKETGSREASAR